MAAACFREYARLIHGLSNTLTEHAMIAATARVHGLTIATRNERDFRSFSVPVFNPFHYKV
jgi:toxin FitB